MTPPPAPNRTGCLPSLTTALIAAFLLSWAGGLVAVRLYAKVFLEPTAKFVNTRPLPFETKPSPGAPVQLFDMTFELPFPPDQLESAYPLLIDHRLAGVILKTAQGHFEKQAMLAVETHPDDLRELPLSPTFRALTRLMLLDHRCSKLFHTLHHAQLDNLSGWNLPHDLRLAYLLTLKAVIWPHYFAGARVQELPPEGMQGFLVEGGEGDTTAVWSEIHAWQRGQFYRINLRAAAGQGTLATVAATLRPAPEDAGKRTYVDTPADFALLSRLTREGMTADALQKLLDLHRQRDPEEAARLKTLAQEIEYLRAN